MTVFAVSRFSKLPLRGIANHRDAGEGPGGVGDDDWKAYEPWLRLGGIATKASLCLLFLPLDQATREQLNGSRTDSCDN